MGHLRAFQWLPSSTSSWFTPSIPSAGPKKVPLRYRGKHMKAKNNENILGFYEVTQGPVSIGELIMNCLLAPTINTK